MANPSTVTLKGYGIQKEGLASETITPGHLIEFGGSNDVQKHSTAGGNAVPMFAVENDIAGQGIGDDYSADDQVLFRVYHTGEEVYAWLADGENVSKGDFLESNGAGLLQAVAADSAANASEVNAVVAQALEDLDLSGSPTANGRIKVQIA